MQVYSKIGKGPADSQEAAAGVNDMPDTKKRKDKGMNDMTDYQLENLILHYVTEEDLTEVARTWPADHHPGPLIIIRSLTQRRGKQLPICAEITGGI